MAKTKNKQFHFMIRGFPKALHKRIKVRAAQLEITMKQFTIEALEAHLRKGKGAP